LPGWGIVELASIFKQIPKLLMNMSQFASQLALELNNEWCLIEQVCQRGKHIKRLHFYIIHMKCTSAWIIWVTYIIMKSDNDLYLRR